MVTIASEQAGGPRSSEASLMAMQARGKKVPASAVSLLELDHRQVQGWFACYADLPPEGKAELARQICIALEAHMQVEEALFYPLVRDAIGEDELLDHGIREHAEAKQMIAELRQMQAGDPQMDAKVRELSAAIDDHVRDEEAELFPKVRASSLDLVELGSRLAARRMAAFAELTGKPHPDLDRHPPEGRGVPGGLAEPAAARTNFIRCLRDAHAMEQQSETMLSQMIGRLADYPEIERRLQAHLEETRAQTARLDEVLEALGESRSMLKDVTASFAGRMGQLGQSMAGDEVLKNLLATYAFESFEAACYEQLMALGELAGEVAAIRTLQPSLNEERAMIAWLEANSPVAVQRFLQLSAEGGREAH